MPRARATAAPTSPETDREALVALYNATGGPDWTYNNNWLSDVPIGQWEDVTSDDNGRVNRPVLAANRLSGEIPPELGNLESLTQLAIAHAGLVGCAPVDEQTAAAIVPAPDGRTRRGPRPPSGADRRPAAPGRCPPCPSYRGP